MKQYYNFSLFRISAATW